MNLLYSYYIQVNCWIDENCAIAFKKLMKIKIKLQPKFFFFCAGDYNDIKHEHKESDSKGKCLWNDQIWEINNKEKMTQWKRCIIDFYTKFLFVII